MLEVLGYGLLFVISFVHPRWSLWLLPLITTLPGPSGAAIGAGYAGGLQASAIGAFNVRAGPFGAKGDGIADDTAAIQLAINAAVRTFTLGGVSTTAPAQVYIPAGIYKCTSTITIGYPATLLGEPTGTALDFTGLAGTGTALKWSGTPSGGGASPYLDIPVLSGITVFGPGIGTTSIGIQQGGAAADGQGQLAQAMLRDCIVDTFGTGLALGLNAFNSLYEHVVFRRNGTGLSDTAANATLEANTFVACTFSRNTMHCNINPVSGAGVDYVFMGCSFDYAQAEPHLTIGSASNVTFVNCHFETDRVGTAGNPLLVRIVFPSDCLTFDQCDFVFKNAVTGIPIAWDTATTLNGTVTFRGCRGSSVGTAFYTETAVGTGFSPVVVVLNSPTLTFGNHLALLINRGSIVDPSQAPAWGASIPVDVNKGRHVLINATSNIAATIANPTNLPTNFESVYLDVEVFNGTGGALTTPVAFGTAYKNSGGVSPANGLSIVVRFRYDGPVRGAFIETGRGTAV